MRKEAHVRGTEKPLNPDNLLKPAGGLKPIWVRVIRRY